MSYIYRNGLGNFDESQRKALKVTPEELAKLSPQDRAELLLRHYEIESQRKSTFWTAVEAIASGALPILAFLGVKSLWSK